jgi:hypothetical protein
MRGGIMPELTPEQKEHFKMAHRANMRIEETWQLFTMFLSQDKKPIDALEMAREAVTVWAEWMDENEVEPPDIQHPDFGQQMADAMQSVMSKLPMPSTIAHFLPQTGQVDAEFIPGAEPEPDTRTTPPSLADQPDSNTK